MPIDEFPIPEFEDDEDNVKYLKYITTFKQEYINHIVMLLFLNRLVEISNGNKNFTNTMIVELGKRFENQIASFMLGIDQKSQAEDSVYDDPDVQRILGGLISPSESVSADDLDDEVMKLALKNIRKVYTRVLQTTASHMVDVTNTLYKNKKEI